MTEKTKKAMYIIMFSCIGLGFVFISSGSDLLLYSFIPLVIASIFMGILGWDSLEENIRRIANSKKKDEDDEE